MNKWCVLLVALVVLGAGMVTHSAAAIEVEGDVYAGVFDKYLWRGHDLSDGRPVLQGGVDLTVGSWTLSTWHNWQLSSSNELRSGELNETDIILSYSFDIGEMVSVSVGDIFYSLDMGAAEDTNELFVTATVNTLLSPTVSIYYDWDAAEEDGLFFTFDISHTLDLAEGLAINFGALVSYNQHSDYAIAVDYSGFHNYELSVGLDYALTDQLAVSPSLTYSSGLTDDAKEAIDSEFLAGVNLTFTF